METLFQTEQVDVSELYHPPSGIVIRAGVIPFIVKDDQRYYLLGLFHDCALTDMGGGCKTSRREKPIDCILREVSEETDDITAKVITETLTNKISYLEVWRQTAKTFSDFGYPFHQKQPGPVYRYYVLLEINDPKMQLGGPTYKEEVEIYQWISSSKIKLMPKERFSLSCQDFLKRIIS